MKDIKDILVELQGLETTTVEGLQAAVVQTVTDLQAFVDAMTPAPAPVVDPIVRVDVVTQSGATTSFLPQA